MTFEEISIQKRKVISTAGMLIFLGTEAMMFATLLAAYIVLRFGSTSWPPPQSPHLPLLLTSINTVVLLSSSIFMHRAGQNISTQNRKKLMNHLLITLILGSGFLSLQAFEWIRLIHEGLVPQTGAFASVFFTITGFHGLHVLIGILLLVFLLIQSMRSTETEHHHNAIHVGSMYWHFVDVVWIIVFVSLYIL